MKIKRLGLAVNIFKADIESVLSDIIKD